MSGVQLLNPNGEVYECYCCGIESSEPACDPCRQAMDAFGAVQCVQCEAYWTSAFDGEWEFPCVQCHPEYKAAYAAHCETVKVPPVPAEDSDEDMGWYEEKKKEWAYAAQLAEAEAKAND